MSLPLLPTGTKMNVAAPTNAEFYDEGQVVYVLRSDKGTFRAATSFGNLGDKLDVGTVHHVKHDQTGRHLGRFEVTAIHTFADGTTEGADIPNKSIPHWVFK